MDEASAERTIARPTWAAGTSKLLSIFFWFASPLEFNPRRSVCLAQLDPCDSE